MLKTISSIGDTLGTRVPWPATGFNVNRASQWIILCCIVLQCIWLQYNCSASQYIAVQSTFHCIVPSALSVILYPARQMH